MVISGFTYRLRPVEINDAQFIVELRNNIGEKSTWLSKVSTDVEIQKQWIINQQKDPQDYYFIIEDRITGEKEGTIGLYNVSEVGGEWGRWITMQNSLSSLESYFMICSFAFKHLNLNSIHSTTHTGNTKVISFHKSMGSIASETQIRSLENPDIFETGIRHMVVRDDFETRIGPMLQSKFISMNSRKIAEYVGQLDFHHLGIACRSIQDEISVYGILGYKPESEYFEDKTQGIRGIFLTAPGQPRIELLENLEFSKTLDVWISRGVKTYHSAYLTENFESNLQQLQKLGAKLVSGPESSEYFTHRIAFLMFPNMYLIELIEAK